MKICNSLSDAVEAARNFLIHTGYEVHTEKWQSTDISDKPEMAMWEALFFSFKAPIPCNNLILQTELKPNMPWASAHFDERVSGFPLNPGESYKKWPFYKMDQAMRTEGEKFSHTYMERFWPKFAGRPLQVTDSLLGKMVNYKSFELNKGIRYDYGDLADVIKLLYNEPDTRQAYLPVWFPEDTGNVMKKRVPCSLGYHFIRRNGHLHMNYSMRSCDLRRHFVDDLYLACRLLLYILFRLKTIPIEQSDPVKEEAWYKTKPGFIKMDITSLHIFKQELSVIKSGRL